MQWLSVGGPCRALAGTPPPLLGIISIVLGFFGVKSYGYENKRPPRWPKMADHVLSILPSKRCTATTWCKLLLRLYSNEEHKGNLFTPPGE